MTVGSAECTGWREYLHPGEELRAIVKEATAALIAMDATRLEELARCCADLNRELRANGTVAQAASALQSAAQDMKVLDRVLFETRANLTVLTRLRVLRMSNMASQAEYGKRLRATYEPLERGAEYGDN
jgi:hypothetical protein